MRSTRPIRFTTFGSPQLVVNGRAARLSRRQPLALLAVLALSSRPVTRDELSFLLWSDIPQEMARQRLRRSLSQLKGALGELAEAAVQPEGQTLRLNEALCEVDAWEFLRLSHQSAAMSFPTAIEVAERAVQLCVGPLLQGLDLRDAPEFEQWVLAQRERFERIEREVLLRLIDGYAQIGAFPRALEAAHRALQLDPLAEALHRRAMWLMDRLGQRSDAIRQYVLFATLIERELGVEPDEQTRALYQALLEGRDAAHTYALAFSSSERASPASVRSPTNVQAEQRIRALVSSAVAPWVAQILDRISNPERVGTALAIHVQGEGGSGKSALLQAVVEQLQEKHPQVAVWTWRATQSHPPSAPFNLIRRLLGAALRKRLAQPNQEQLPPASDDRAASLSEALRLIPELRLVFPHVSPPERNTGSDLPPTLSRDARLARERLLASTVGALYALVGRRRTVIVVDDVDRADPESLEALARALLGHTDQAVVFLLSGRTCPPGLGELLNVARQRQLLWTITLPLLPSEAVVDALAEAGVARERAVELWNDSRGSPLVTIEMMRARLSGAEPGTLAAAIAHNLAALDPLARRIVESVAVLGACTLADIQHMTGQELGDIEVQVDRLIEQDWLAQGEGEYAIAHPEIQAVVLDRATAARKQRLHLLAARLLSHAQAEPAQVAWHLERAGYHEEAAQAWLRAAQRAADAFAPEFALRAVQHGRSLTVSSQTQFDLLCLQEAVLHTHGLHAEQAATLDSLQALADEPDAPATWLAEVRYRRGRWALARNAWGEAVDALQRAAACCLHDDVKVLLLLARALVGAGQSVEARQRLAQALALAEQHGDRAEQLQCWVTIAEVALQREQFEEAHAALSRAVSLSDKLSPSLPYLLLALGKLAGTRNDFSAALAYAQEAQALFARRGIPDGEAEACTLAARMLARLSRLGEAVQAYEQAYRGHAALHARQGMAAARVNAATLALRLGEFERGLSFAQEAYHLFEAIQDGRGLCVAASNLGFALIYLGRAEAAVCWLRESHQRAVELQLPAQQASALSNLGAALLQQGDLIEARAHMEAGLALRETLGHVDVSIDCSFLAIACLRLGDLDSAERYAKRAVAVLDQIPQAENPQQVWFAYAQVLRALGRDGESKDALSRAVALLHRTRDLLAPEHAARYLAAFPFNLAILRAWEQGKWPNPPAMT